MSAQGRYEFGYNAARIMATVVIRASGHRVTSQVGHHFYTFKALKASDPTFESIAVYFDAARDARNNFSYDAPASISDTDAEDLVQAVTQFIIDAEAWISANHPTLAK